MKKRQFILIVVGILALTALLFGYTHRANAESGFFTSNCQGCHTVSTCNGCHAHGTHPTSAKSSLNIVARTDKSSYQPGEIISVTVSGGYRTGWVRVILYNGDPTAGGVEITRSTGPNGQGGGQSFPITLTGKAPSTPGTYSFSASWYGNKFDKSGAFFGSKWRPDANNPNHGEEIVATNSFTVVSATPAPTPAITVTDSVSPATDLSVPFGTVTTGSSATQTVTIKNTGTAALNIGAAGSANALAAPFTIKTDACSNQSLAASASCTITLAFAPSTAGAFSDSFAITSNDPAKGTVTVNVNGDGAAAPVPAITVTDSVSPTTDLLVPFGSITTGTSATQTVTVKNTGTANLLIAAVASANPLAAPFSVKSDTCSNQTVAPAATCSIALTFAPGAAGSFSDSFSIPSNDAAKSTVTVNVSGSGTTVPVPAISVTDSVTPNNDLLVPFGSVAIASSATQTVSVKNMGNADLALGAVASANPLATPFTIKTDTCSNQIIAPAGTCTITLAFGPTAAGTFTDSFNIPSNDTATGTVTMNLSGSGSTTAVADIQITDGIAPADDLRIPFGDVRAGRTMDSVVTVSNTADGQLSLGTIGFVNPPAAPFSILADGCSGKNLATGEKCTMTVRFAAPEKCTRTSDSDDRIASTANSCAFSDSFNIPSNDPDEKDVTIQLSGGSVPGAGNVPPSKPRHRFPADGQKDLETALTMRWEAASDPDGDQITYEVQLATDTSFSSNMIVAGGTIASGRSAGTLYASSGLGILFFGFAFTRRGRNGLFIFLAVLVLAGTGFVACSSSGGGSAVATPTADVTRQVSGLQQGTTYFWKVIASDGKGGVAESDVTAFTTK